MNHTTFLLGLTIPFLLLGGIMRSTIDFGATILQYMLLLYTPILTPIRIKYVGLTGKEMLFTFIPVFGMKYPSKVFTEK